MNSRDFAYWLQGYFELNGVGIITKHQAQIIQNHLNLVFKHEIDPSIDNNDPTKINQLNAIHRPPNHLKEDSEEFIRC
jgi:hypothetical protein